MGDDKKKHGKGRPRIVENGYSSDCHVRLSDDEVSMLNDLSIEKGIGVSKALREGLKLYYNYTMKRF